MDVFTLLEGMRLYWKGQKRCLGACHALELVLKEETPFETPRFEDTRYTQNCLFDKDHCG